MITANLLPQADAITIATAVRSGDLKATTVIESALAQIIHRDPQLNCFTTVLKEAALAQAADIDRAVLAGEDPGPLAGVPFAVKNLLDIQGVVTLAGSALNRENPPAEKDATVVARWRKAGAILLGGLNMDEYAYGFTSENHHYGPVHNPHQPGHMAGGSSGGSAAAVAAGLVPLTLGSDTNGSIRVPASLCGVFGLKPTYGRVSRAGAMLFASSFDHIGPFARAVRDLALSFDLLQGSDPRDPVCTEHPPELTSPQLSKGIEGLRIAVAGGYFAQGADPQVLEAVQQVAQALGTVNQVEFPEPHRARAAAYLITASEGANLHLQRLRTRPQAFDPETRDRFLAGVLMPAQWVQQAQRFRRWYRQQMQQVFTEWDVIIAPTTPCAAPPLGQTTMILDGREVLTRPNLGLYTQPLSFIGLPVVSVPVHHPHPLPVGVQLVAAPYQEAALLRAAAWLEAAGVVQAPVA
ncbi:MAG: AtzE family amidohydrolase [Synechococcaceae cyanobacterium SM2_3_1]|nr:AtzE family amidohydrolase [Synechococcaceae cyanobacterium SM2_3_1]